MFASISFKHFGKCVKQIRTNVKYTQKYVSELSGINIDTIRRIENGLVVPKYETLELLSNIYKFDLIKLLITSRNENKLYKLYLDFDRVIISMTDQRQIELDNFNQLINAIDISTQVNQNEVILLKELIATISTMFSGKNYNHNDKIENLVNTLKLGIPHFNLDQMSNFFYSELEIRSLLIIGIIFKDKNESSKSIPIFDFCLNYLLLTTGCDDLNSIKLKIKLYYNLSYAYYKIEDDKKSLKAANLGIKLCHENNLHYCLEMLLARKAVAELYLKDERYMHTFKDALYLLYALGEHQQIEYLVSKTKEKHGVDLSNITATFY